ELLTPRTCPELLLASRCTRLATPTCRVLPLRISHLPREPTRRLTAALLTPSLRSSTPRARLSFTQRTWAVLVATSALPSLWTPSATPTSLAVPCRQIFQQRLQPMTRFSTAPTATPS